MSLATNLTTILKRIKNACEQVGRPLTEVKPIWVTKTVSIATIKEVLALNQQLIGENKAQEIAKKIPLLRENNYQCHFLGNLQSNKIKNVIPHIHYLHSLDKITLAEKIEKFLQQNPSLPKLKVLIQINSSGETNKHGIKENELDLFLEKTLAFSRLEIKGLMTMAPFTEDQKAIRSCFRGLKKLQLKTLEKFKGKLELNELSMGMSNDFELAIAEGATMVRIGRLLFGERN